MMENLAAAYNAGCDPLWSRLYPGGCTVPLPDVDTEPTPATATGVRTVDASFFAAMLVRAAAPQHRAVATSVPTEYDHSSARPRVHRRIQLRPR